MSTEWLTTALSSAIPRSWASFLPSGFDSYVRVLHPAYRHSPEGAEKVTWREVAHSSGTRVRPFSTWEEIAPAQSSLQKPVLGSSPPEVLGPVLREALRSSRPASGELCLAWWDGFGPPAVPCPGPGTRLDLPARTHTVCRWPVDALDRLLGGRRSPSLLWPSSPGRPDWVVVVEVDDRSTVVAGGVALADRLGALPGLECLVLDHASAGLHSP